MGAFWTVVASGAYGLAAATGWKWPRRFEAWAWHVAGKDT